MKREPIEMPHGARTILAPSLLSADFARLGEEVAALEAGGADWLHFDVMDGRFVPNLSIGLPVLEAVRRITRLPIDVHLMIVEPERYVEAFVAAGADVVTVHPEVSPHLHRTLQMIRAAGARAGVALNPATPILAIEHVIDAVDLVLIMTVNPGFGGQSYIDACTRKITAVRQLAERQGVALDIEVDGGIKRDNIAVPAAAGANVFVSGSGVLGTADYGATMAAMRAALG